VIRHKKQITRPDGRDPTQVQPSDWIDDHVIVDGIALPVAEVNPSPGTGEVALFAQDNGGQPVLSVREPGRAPVALQPHLAFKNIRLAQARGNSTVVSVFGLLYTTTGGSFSSTMASTTLKDSVPRRGHETAASADSAAGWRANFLSNFRGSDGVSGGFLISMRFALDTAPTGARFFAGLLSSTNAIGGASDPGSFASSLMAIGFDAADADWQFIRHDGSGSPEKVASTIARNTTSLYEFLLFARSGDDEAYFTLRDLTLGLEDRRVFTTKLPAASTMLALQMSMSSGATGVACQFSVSTVYVETEY
jgi:hypothetical protein